VPPVLQIPDSELRSAVRLPSGRVLVKLLLPVLESQSGRESTGHTCSGASIQPVHHISRRHYETVVACFITIEELRLPACDEFFFFLLVAVRPTDFYGKFFFLGRARM
jgi:hypothetical protein